LKPPHRHATRFPRRGGPRAAICWSRGCETWGRRAAATAIGLGQRLEYSVSSARKLPNDAVDTRTQHANTTGANWCAALFPSTRSESDRAKRACMP
jgi:hypothetical protein